MSTNDIQELLLNDLGEEQNGALPIDYVDSDILFIEELESLPDICFSKLKVNIICSCNKGKMELDVNGKHYVVHETEVLVCPSGVVIDNLLVSPDFKFTVLCLTDRIIQLLLSSNIDIWNRAVYIKKEHVVVPSKGKDGTKHHLVGIHFIELVHKLLAFKDNPFREEMLRSMLQIVLLGYCARQKQIERSENNPSNKKIRSPQGQILFTKFMELLRDEDIKHKPVYYYAEKLYISPKYLSHVCKEISGKSANEFIQTAVVEEITHYLKNTTFSVKEIANKLGFPNISFFGKYVKSHLGMSPNEYRKHFYNMQY
jgi:AraC family transcriptional activator of pobA